MTKAINIKELIEVYNRLEPSNIPESLKMLYDLGLLSETGYDSLLDDYNQLVDDHEAYEKILYEEDELDG